MSTFEVIVLGVIQGVTEFLPVSSDGHLVAAHTLFGFTEDGGIAFTAWLHLGTLLAVLVYFRDIWWGIVRGVVVGGSERREAGELMTKLIVATLPGAVAGYYLRTNETWLQSPELTAIGFLITALALVIIDLPRERERKGVSLTDAFLIGLAQVLALAPGISRSGMTIAAGRVKGLSRQSATVFSFLMSAPIVSGAVLISIPALGEASIAPAHLLLGAFISFITGLCAISIFLRLIQRMTLTPFVIYLVCLAALLGWVVW